MKGAAPILLSFPRLTPLATTIEPARAAPLLQSSEGCPSVHSGTSGRMQLSYPQPCGFHPSIRTLPLRPAPCASPRPIPFPAPSPGTKPVTTLGPYPLRLNVATNSLLVLSSVTTVSWMVPHPSSSPRCL